jgi:hypothetical protein
MNDNEPKRDYSPLIIGCVSVLVAVALVIGLFFGVCSMLRR